MDLTTFTLLTIRAYIYTRMQATDTCKANKFNDLCSIDFFRVGVTGIRIYSFIVVLNARMLCLVCLVVNIKGIS
jgi:hypothetical protein